VEERPALEASDDHDMVPRSDLPSDNTDSGRMKFSIWINQRKGAIPRQESADDLHQVD